MLILDITARQYSSSHRHSTAIVKIMKKNAEQIITSFMTLFKILNMQQEARKKHFKNTMKHMRMTLRKLCLQHKNELFVRWSLMTNPKSPILILHGIKYQRRIWTKVRSNDFWQRIVGEHFTLSEWLTTF